MKFWTTWLASCQLVPVFRGPMWNETLTGLQA